MYFNYASETAANFVMQFNIDIAHKPCYLTKMVVENSPVA